MKKPRITKLLGWDGLNKGAILVTLTTGISAILSYLGVQSITTIILLSVSAGSFSIALSRAYRIKGYLIAKDTLVKHILEHGKYITKDIHSIRVKTDDDQEVNQGSVIKLEHEALSRVARSLSESISSITGEKMEVAIKLFSTGEDGQLIANTFVSTYPSERASAVKNEVLDYNTHLSRALSESRAVFINELMREPNYMNQNPKWQNYYQSCAVAPIATRASGGRFSQTWYGVVVVDSKKPKVFTNEVLPIIEFYADWCSLLLSQMYMLSSAEQGAPADS